MAKQGYDTNSSRTIHVESSFFSVYLILTLIFCVLLQLYNNHYRIWYYSRFFKSIYFFVKIDVWHHCASVNESGESDECPYTTIVYIIITILDNKFAMRDSAMVPLK